MGEIALGDVSIQVGVHRFTGSGFKVQGSGVHSRPRTAFGMRIYEKGVSFVRSNPKFGDKLAITWGNEHF